LITSREAPAVEAAAFEQKDVGCGKRVHASVSLGEHEPDQQRGPAVLRANTLACRHFGTFQPDSKDFIAALLPRPPVSAPYRRRAESALAHSTSTWEIKMKRWISKGALVATIALPALSGVARADDFGCSNATLKGEYAFGVTSYTPPGLPDGPPAVAAGIKVFDGKGNLTQRDYRGDTLRTSNPPQTDFAKPGQETGTYIVNLDCTGSMEIHLNVPNTPVPQASWRSGS